MYSKLKKTALVFCIIYTTIGLLSQTVKVAWAFDEYDLERMIKRIVSSEVKDAVSSKISAYDYDFKQQVMTVVEDSCKIRDDRIRCY